MERFEDLWEKRPGGGGVALGFFDGVHLGHQAVIGSMVKASKAGGLVPRVFTFDPGSGVPAAKSGFTLLQSEEQKESAMAQLGVKEIICPGFSEAKELEPAEFIEKILLRNLGAKVIACGFNYRFGKGAVGDVNLLRKVCAAAGIEVIVVDPVSWQGETVSSTRIRNAIREGNMEAATAMLGVPFSLCQPILHGRQLGRQMQIPTINQRFPPGFTIPRHGVYQSRVRTGDVCYGGVTNVGVKPTVDGEKLNCETYILDFSGDLYGKTVEVGLVRFLRDEARFASVEALREQICKDVEKVRTQPL